MQTREKVVHIQQVATIDHCIYCFDTLVSHFEKSSVPKPPFKNEKYPLFVTWHKQSSSHKEPVLRGCKGTFEHLDIHKGLQDFALISALKDKRFAPVSHSEVNRLECSVSLLFAFEECEHVYDWEIGKHGIIIEFRDPNGTSRNATYLPEVAPEQEWNKEETVLSLIKKAGWEGPVTQELLQKIKTTRYQSSQSKMSYQEYVNLKLSTKGTN